MNSYFYPAYPIGDVTIAKDFLPPPEQLIAKKVTVKVTMEFTKESIEFFKREARLHNTSYQEIICNLLDVYAKQNQK